VIDELNHEVDAKDEMIHNCMSKRAIFGDKEVGGRATVTILIDERVLWG